MTAPILVGKEAADHLKNLDDPTAYRCTNPNCICRIVNPPVQILTRTPEMVTFYFFSRLYGQESDQGETMPGAMDRLLTWANEFNTIHAATKWGEGDNSGYMEALNEFYEEKRASHD